MLDLRRTSPVDDIAQPPGILVQLDLELAILVDGELAGWIQNSVALTLILVIQLELARRKVESLRLCVEVRLTKSDFAVGDETDRSTGRGLDQSDEGEIVPQGSRYLDASDGFHFGKRVDKSLILALLKRFHENLTVFWCRPLINNDGHANIRAQLGELVP